MNNILHKLQARVIELEKDLSKFKEQVKNNKSLSLENNINDALYIEKAGKKIISIDTIVGKEQLNINRKTVFNDVTQFGSLLVRNNVITTNDTSGNLILQPGKKGDVIIRGNPKNNLSVVNKRYVDYLSRGFTLISPVIAKITNTMLPFTVAKKDNMDKIIGYKTSLNDCGIDGYKELKEGDRILVTLDELLYFFGENYEIDEIKKCNTGIYTIENLGNKNTQWVLKKTNEILRVGLCVFIEHGDTCGNTSWVATEIEPENGMYKFIKFSSDENLAFSNIGRGAKIFKSKEHSHVKFKTIYSDNLIINENEDSIIINMDNPKSKITNQILDSKPDTLCDMLHNRLKFDLSNVSKYVNIKFPRHIRKTREIELVGKETQQQLLNKVFLDTLTWFCDDYDNSKKMRFDLFKVPEKNEVVITIPPENIELVGVENNQILSNKILDSKTTKYKSGKNEFMFDFSNKPTDQQIKFPKSDAILVNISSKQSLKNKTLDCRTTLFENKKTKSRIRFDLHNISKDVESTYVFPKKSTELVGIDSKQEITNKVIDMNKNTIIQKYKNNYVSKKDPDFKKNLSNGFRIGSRWINEKSGEEFVCVRCSSKSSMWKKTT